MTEVLASLPVADILTLYKKKKLSPVEVTGACLRQVFKYNPVLNAFSLLDESHAQHQAVGSEQRWMKNAPMGLLDGIPVTVKDWFHYKGWATRYGSKTSSPLRQPEDSPPVARLREQGGIFIGKTTLPEYGHKGVTDSPLTGITRNPWNIAKTCGGSSGGAAVAAATGMGLLNLGSDAGGSIRIPASFCGVVGFKPSAGLVPSYPPSLFSTLSAVGGLVRCVEDAALMLDVLTLPDGRDWHALPYEQRNYLAALKKPLPRLKIAYASSINDITATAPVLDGLKNALAALQEIGDIEEVSLTVPKLVDVFNKHWMAVAAHSVKSLTLKQRALMDPRYQQWAARGNALSLQDYLDAERNRMVIGEYFKAILDSYDILVTPTTAMTGFDAGVNMPLDAKGKPWEDWTPFTYPANLAKLPALSLPAGLSREGMPVGLQIMGGFLKDALVLQTAKQLQERLKVKSFIAL
jgi:aspartyl-tRNA(Asn)/glutamyl-tRNA(Gln) amidotransferase subunit A